MLKPFVLLRQWTILPLALLVLAVIGLLPAGAQAAVLPFGVDLASAPTPTLDTANGAVDPGVGPNPAIKPNPHDAADAVFYNTVLPVGSNVAPAGGQVLQIKVKGCAVEDTSAPVQTSTGGDNQQHPVNTVNFETIASQSDGSFKVDQISANHLLPFCVNTKDQSAAGTPDTVTTFQPLHMCITAGEAVDFTTSAARFRTPTDGPTIPRVFPSRCWPQSRTRRCSPSPIRPSSSSAGATPARLRIRRWEASVRRPTRRFCSRW